MDQPQCDAIFSISSDSALAFFGIGANFTDRDAA
jgi:hypothetical protein